MELCLKLGKLKQECQRGTSSKEFVLWKVFLEEKLNEPEIEHYYLAQIAAEIRRVLAKLPKSISFKDFLFKFKVGGKKAQTAAPDPEEAAKKAGLASKNTWLSALGLGGKK